MHTEYMSTTSSEKACLSVSRRRPCPSERRPVEERTGRPVKASGQELSTEHAQIRILVDRKSKSSPNARRRLRNTNFRLIMTEEVYKN